MRRAILVGVVVGLISFAPVSRAQVAAEATLKTPAETETLTIVESGGRPYFPVDDVITALGGTVSVDDSGGTHVKIGSAEAVLGTESRYCAVGQELIEMPSEPVRVENRLFVPWQFFRGYLRLVELDASWDAATRTLTIGPLQRETIRAQISVVDVGGLTKVVLELSSRTEFSVSRTATSYLIRTRNPIQAPFEEQAFEDPFVAAVKFEPTQVEIRLRSTEVVASSYKLDKPFRIVLDLKHGQPPAPTTTTVAPPVRPRRPTERPGVHTIVLDPGHGGRETGAVGPTGLLEKDVTLAICRKLKESLVKTLGVRVILTRDDDSVVPLDERTAIANQYHADLFLSVHLNSAPYKNVSGSETYFLSLEASDERAQMAAERENASPGGTPPAEAHSDLDMILWDLAQQDYLKESSRFAELIQDEMAHATGIEKRGVKQAPFRVLVGATMPAALVEVGFISNPDEEAKLKDPAYLDKIVTALTTAIVRYKSEYETRVGVLSPGVASPTPPTDPSATKSATTGRKAGS